MDSKNYNEYDEANSVSKLFCLYIFGFLKQHYNKTFGLDSIKPCSRRDQCDRLSDRLRKNWNVELENRRIGKSASIVRALVKTFWMRSALILSINLLLYAVIRMAQAMSLGLIIRYANLYREELEKKSQMLTGNKNFTNLFEEKVDSSGLSNKQNVYLYSGVLGLAVVLNFILSHPNYIEMHRMGMHYRICVSRLVYEKALRISNGNVQKNTVGKIVNLISNDASRSDITFAFVFALFTAPVTAAVGLWLLSTYMGNAWLTILLIVIAFILFQIILANLLKKIRLKSIKLTDDRLRLMAEILPAMRVIKMYVWEKPFGHLVHVARKAEITQCCYAMFIRCINYSFGFVSNKLMAFAAILIFLFNEGKLNSEVVFVCLTLTYQIREMMTFLFPMALSYTIEFYVSYKRIERFLLEEEVDIDDEKGHKLGFKSSSIGSISLRNVCVKSELDGNDILKDISFETTAGKLTVIIGPVGSGKSSILLSILKELSLTSGTIDVKGQVIYASQEAWIFAGTVRENILFGREFDPVLYKKVVKVSALQSDLEKFPEGDQTFVEDRGTSLSGGQRARISLARALYTDSDCILLDDPLSAVDASVAKHIFEKCIKSYLKEKCVILVTHQLQFIKSADQIVVLKDGGCLACGSYGALLRKAVEIQAQEGLHLPVSRVNSLTRSRFDSASSEILKSRTSTICSVESMDFSSDMNSFQPEDNKVDETQIEASITTKTNQSKLQIYYSYFRMGAGLIFIILFLLLLIGIQFLYTGSDYWLSAWTDYTENQHIQQIDPDYEFERNPVVFPEKKSNIFFYSVLMAALFAGAILKTITFFVICMRSSINLHNRVLSSLLQVPIAFFDKTPVGIIMNRVSRDLGIIDDVLPITFYESIDIICNSIAVVCLCAFLNYYVLIPLIFLLVLLYMVVKFYVSTGRQLRRLEASARSPIYNQLASSLAGLATIRSYRTQEMFIRRFAKKQDLHSATLFTFHSASRLFGISMEFMCLVYILSMIFLLALNLDVYTGSLIGLTISQSLTLTANFNWGVRQAVEVETYMTSVERVKEFGELDREELESCGQEPGKEWPHQGDITFHDVCLYYNKEEPPVLKNLNFTICGGEKIGIVGRTGAGKSSIINTLFRLTQPTGSIRIDGIDTGEVSLSSLRKSLSIIPQEPVMFSGTMRRNLDPFNEKDDSDLWNAVDKVQLRHKVQSLPGKLDNPLSDGGADFSVGQKQLICLARAILRKNKILILDEATANVDQNTDSLIQDAIRREFDQCTVLTIAHRLNTIIDYDRVLVLDKGEVAQFDTPHALISEGKGIFFDLYEDLNSETKKELARIAFEIHQKSS